MTERANMPSISTAARQEFAKHPDSFKNINGTTKKQPTVLTTCIVCNKQYNKAESDTILADLPTLANFPYENTCLSCIKEGSDLINEANHQQLLTAKQELDKLAILYQTAHNKHKAIANKHKSYDYQSSMINHHLTKPVKVAKTGTKRTPKTEEQKKADMIKKMLGNLTEEQLKNIMKTV